MNGFMRLELENTTSVNSKIDIFDNAISLAEIPSIDGSLWQLCLHPFEYKRDLNPDLEGLLENGSTNPFFNTAFIAASRDRMIKGKMFQLIMWENSGNEKIARFSVPVSKQNKTFLLPEHFKSLTHPFAPFGDPVIDLSTQEETIQRLGELLHLAFTAGMEPIVFDYLSANSPIHKLGETSDSQIGAKTIELGQRASIDLNSVKSGAKITSKKRVRELNRLRKKLEQEGDVVFQHTRDPIEIMIRFEEFLLMETRGWKGRIGSSIHVIKKHAAFARQSVNDLAKEGLCEIFTMRFNGSPIASIIMFESGGHYFPWKISYNHLFSKYSPGSQLMHQLTTEITKRDGFQSADSLAKFGKSWMTNLWPDEIAISTLTVARDESSAVFLANRIEQQSNLKALAKKIILRR